MNNRNNNRNTGYATIVFVLITMLTNIVSASWRDTGFITMEQPNGKKFNARQWGDEFESWMVTDEGYRMLNRKLHLTHAATYVMGR